MENNIDKYLKHLQSRGYSHRTIIDYRYNFRLFHRYLRQNGIDQVAEITRDHITAYQNWLYHEYRSRKDKPLCLSTQMTLLKILKPFFHYLIREGTLLSNPALDIELPKLPKRLPRDILTRREIKRILSLPDLKTPSGRQDRGILEMLYSTGLRLGELRNLRLNDINLKDRECLIREGKGGRDRCIPIPARTADYLRGYITEWREQRLGDTPCDALFLNNHGRPLGKNFVGIMLRRYNQKLSIRKHITSHSFRHTCATHLLKNNASIRVIQELLGHSSLSTTQLYTKVEISDLKRVIDKCHPRRDME